MSKRIICAFCSEGVFMRPVETCWKANENFMLRTIAGESVLVAIGEVPDPRLENAMISINETGAFLWQLFAENPATEAQAVEAAELEFSAPDGVIANHIHAFIRAFSEIGLLVKEEQ